MIVRHLPFCVADGPRQMAADEAMLHAAAVGRASFRLYGWSEPTASLGYFQSHRVRAEGLAELPFVRRPTGGLTLVHDREVTYALAVADDSRLPAHAWLERVHRVIAAALADLGVRTELAGEDRAPAEETSLCFRHVTRGDLLIGPHKVAGSAQRRQRGALLQHGAILLNTSPHTPSLPGIDPLTGRRIAASEIGSRFEVKLGETLGWQLAHEDWAAAEREKIETLADEKYRSPRWNERR